MRAAERHPHLAEPRTPGTVRVDCHVHTMWSGDSTTTPDELAAAVVDAGVDVLCITDHSTVAGATRFAASGELGCRVIVGQEQRTPDGELIGLFLTERLPAGLTSAAALARAVREQGGLVYVPHPYDPMRHRLPEAVLLDLVDQGLVDVLEAFNAKTSLPHLNEAVAAFARSRGVAAGAGSDAHVPEALGAAYVEMPDFPDAGGATFLAALRSGRTVGHHSDPARRWRARVVPSTSE
jgi:predicted metal-dependent phosphoesterase TrpH